MTGQQVKALRESAQMTQTELAEYLGLRFRDQVSRIESGQRQLSGAERKLLQQLEKKILEKSRKKP